MFTIIICKYLTDVKQETKTSFVFGALIIDIFFASITLLAILEKVDVLIK